MKIIEKTSGKSASEGSTVYPRFLMFIGIVISATVFLESYFQLTGSSVGLLKLAHSYGFLEEFKAAKEPNKGIWHMVGWVGSGCFIAMMLYSFRKRVGFMKEVGSLRYWLDTHMFLGIVGTLLITAHSTYKVGGIVSLSFWSMVLVTASGFIGRYIYVQIPRSITGNELRINELGEVMMEINVKMERVTGKEHKLPDFFRRISGPKNAKEMGLLRAIVAIPVNDIANIFRMWKIRREIARIPRMPQFVKKQLYKLVKEKGRLRCSLNFFSTSHKLLHYWHVFHKPFAIIMFLVMFIHIAVFYVFRT